MQELPPLLIRYANSFSCSGWSGKIFTSSCFVKGLKNYLQNVFEIQLVSFITQHAGRLYSKELPALDSRKFYSGRAWMNRCD
jgi:hypothetical protein